MDNLVILSKSLIIHVAKKPTEPVDRVYVMHANAEEKNSCIDRT